MNKDIDAQFLCKDCSRYHLCEYYHRRKEDSYICKHFHLSETPKTGWIPISEKLPEDGEWAIFTDGNLMSIERYKMDALDHFYPEGRYFNLEDAVAWMPLPKKYEPQKGGE